MALGNSEVSAPQIFYRALTLCNVLGHWYAGHGSVSVLIEERWLLSKILQYMTTSVNPSMLCSCPVTLAEKQPPNKMLPPPCLTVGMVEMMPENPFFLTLCWPKDFLPAFSESFAGPWNELYSPLPLQPCGGLQACCLCPLTDLWPGRNCFCGQVFFYAWIRWAQSQSVGSRGSSTFCFVCFTFLDIWLRVCLSPLKQNYHKH